MLEAVDRVARLEGMHVSAPIPGTQAFEGRRLAPLGVYRA